MLDDCEAGKIDIILTKSISRFARNTVDLLKTVRHLKDLGIEVQFEKEHINSLSGDGEVMLTLLASFAQSESESISTNVKWGIRKRMQSGIPYANGHMNVYGYRWEGDEMVIVPEEATIVKRIYQNFLDGKSRQETEKEFAAEGIKTRQGYKWTDSNLKLILTNVTYTGNMLYQKEYVVDPISKKTRKNHGELPQYYVENTHPAIIDKETFDYVQAEMTRRRELGCFGNKALTLNCFSTKIKCGCCGRSFVRSKRRNRAKHSNLGEYDIFWVCTSHKKKKHPGQVPCTSGVIRETVLKEEIAKVLNISEFDEDVFSERVRQIIDCFFKCAIAFLHFSYIATSQTHFGEHHKKLKVLEVRLCIICPAIPRRGILRCKDAFSFKQLNPISIDSQLFLYFLWPHIVDLLSDLNIASRDFVPVKHFFRFSFRF